MDDRSDVRALAARMMSREATCGTTRVFGIDGRSGSGKTALALDLSDVLGCPILHLENVYPGWYGLATAINELRTFLSSLAIGEISMISQWDWLNDRPGAPLVIAPPPMLIVEGAGAGASGVRPFLSHLLWVDAPDGVRRERALSRDGEIYAPWWDVWAGQEDTYMASDRPKEHADIIIRTAPEVL